MKRVILLLLAPIMFMMSSCATIFNGERQFMSVKSLTPGSKIYIDGNLEGEDAVSKKLKRDTNHSVIIKKEGYKTQSVNIDKHIQVGWVILDIFTLTWPSLIIDAITGSWNALDRNNIVLELEPNK